MGSWSNGNVVNLLCLCHPTTEGRNRPQKMAEVTPGLGIEIVSRHRGIYHTGSLSVRDLLTQLSGTTDGSAIIDFVRETVGSG